MQNLQRNSNIHAIIGSRQKILQDAMSMTLRRISTKGKLGEVNQDSQYILKGSSV